MPAPSFPRIPPRLATALLAVGGGLCLAASVPPWGWWPLAFVGVAVWDRLLASTPAKGRFLRSWLLGAAWLAPAMLWMYDLTPVGYPIAVAVFGAYVGVAGLAVPGGSDRSWVRWLAVPGAFTLAEAARWTFPFGGVPLATTAMSQAAAPLGQIARIGCAIGVVFVVGVVGVALSAAWERNWRVAVGSLAGVAVLLGVAVLAPDGRSVGSIEVALVQGGGEQGTRAEDTDPRVVFERHLEASGRIVPPVDLVVWPENVVDVEGPVGSTKEGRELSELARELDTTLVVGVTEGVDSESFVNASVVYLPDGSQGDRYEKVRRVPFGEYVPLRGLIEGIAGDQSGLPLRDAVAGTGPAVLDTPVGTMGVAISWEVFFTNRARDAALHGGQILLNPTNGSSYWLTQVQTQQIASSRLRAIETGRWVLQAAPTGFSAIVDPDGRVLARTSISEQAVLQDVVERREGDTVATAIGPLPVIVLSALSVGAAWWLASGRARLRARRAPSPDPR
ncbi:MAG TPA: apolipoprotein N-acyltransferase [Acidimicrobiales bacterium]